MPKEPRYSVCVFLVPVVRDSDRKPHPPGANSFDERVMYLEVAGYAELLEVRPEDGFLEV